MNSLPKASSSLAMTWPRIIIQLYFLIKTSSSWPIRAKILFTSLVDIPKVQKRHHQKSTNLNSQTINRLEIGLKLVA